MSHGIPTRVLETTLKSAIRADSERSAPASAAHKASPSGALRSAELTAEAKSLPLVAIC